MKEYIIKVNKNKIDSPSIKLVQNDYNSTKLIFEFDFQEDYAKVFQMKYPSGASWIKEIINNELVLADENNSEIVPVLVENGIYEYDIAIYDGNSKLTTTEKARFTVRKKIEGENIELDDRAPILDDLINQTHNAIKQVGDIQVQGDYAKEQGDYAKQEAEKVDSVVEYVVATSIEANNTAKKAESIAKGRATGYVFDTEADLDLWLKDTTNTSKLVLGDNLYIRAKEVPDYWWDGNDKQPLETQKVELGDYVKSSKEDNIVYCKYTGQDYGIEFSSGTAKAYTMVRRDSRGGIITADPTRNDEAATKAYVDRLNRAYYSLYGTFTNGILYISNPDYQEYAEDLYKKVTTWTKNNLGTNAEIKIVDITNGTFYLVSTIEEFYNIPNGVYITTIGDM